MTVLYDGEPTQATAQYVGALSQLLRAKLSILQDAEATNAEDWAWGLCVVGDLADQSPYEFRFGPERTKPKILGESAIAVVVRDSTSEQVQDYLVYTEED